MLPFSFESENRTIRGILSMGGRELLANREIQKNESLFFNELRFCLSEVARSY
jgi:hypothetical protein